MKRPRDPPRPLVSGLGIRSYTGTPGRLSHVGRGTLTGVATRNSDCKKVLVTALHVMAGRDDEGNFRNPSGNEMMFQGLGNWRDKVGSNLAWVPISFSEPNVVDVATCDLDDGVGAEFKLHDIPQGDRTIIAGTKAPEEDMPVTMLGAVSSEVTGCITSVGLSDAFNGARFEDIMRIDWDRSIATGDSGAPVLYKVSQGVYRMVAILFAQTILYPSVGWAFPASTVEQKMGITFAKEANVPTITNEGFLGQRWIIDDYFKAGETLHAGDVVVVKKRSATSTLPRVFKATGSHQKRVIGIVHTPASKVVGEQMATTGSTTDADEYVPVVVKGIAKTLSGGAMGVGDPVMASGSSATPTAPAATPAPILGAVATVVDASTHSHSPDSDGMTGADGAHSHTVSGIARGPQIRGPRGVDEIRTYILVR